MPDDKTLIAEAVLRDLDRVEDTVDKDDRMSRVDNSYGIPDDIHFDARTMIALTIGTRFDLASIHAVKDSVRQREEVRRRFPESPVYICVMGYDDDPREVGDIPEAARFYRRWFRLAGIRTPEQAEAQKLTDFSIATLAICGAFGRELQEAAREVARAVLPPTPPIN